jgi:hypothetical protein
MLCTNRAGFNFGANFSDINWQPCTNTTEYHSTSQYWFSPLKYDTFLLPQKLPPLITALKKKTFAHYYYCRSPESSIWRSLSSFNYWRLIVFVIEDSLSHQAVWVQFPTPVPTIFLIKHWVPLELSSVLWSRPFGWIFLYNHWSQLWRRRHLSTITTVSPPKALFDDHCHPLIAGGSFCLLSKIHCLIRQCGFNSPWYQKWLDTWYRDSIIQPFITASNHQMNGFLNCILSVACFWYSTIMISQRMIPLIKHL